MAITFQSTRLKASTSVMTPAQTIAATPIRAATAPSIRLLMTAMIDIANIASVTYAKASIDGPLSRYTLLFNSPMPLPAGLSGRR